MPASYTNTLRYWFDVEALTYPDIPKPGSRRDFSLRYSEKLPWMHELAAPITDDHKYFVYFGLVEKKVLESELLTMFKVTPERDTFSGNHVRQVSGKTFLCAIEITANGVPVMPSLQLAAFAVAFANRKNNTCINHSITLDSLQSKMKTRLSQSPTGADSAWFQHIIQFLVNEIGWAPITLMAREHICAHRVSLLDKKGKRLTKVIEMDPINSFYLDDLERMLHEAECGCKSDQIERYLDGHERSAVRIDVSEFSSAEKQLAAHRFPLGRWPSKFPLFLMQQVAVNTGVEMLKKSGIFSVNGPPGTGKTTLLMDMIAARLVERAQILMQFNDPREAFSQVAERSVYYPPNKSGIVKIGPIYAVDERLLDCGIVVTSANNKAVENITLDLPSIEKVAPQPLLFDGAPFDYFGATAEFVLNGGSQARVNGNASDIEAGNEEDSEAAEHEPLTCWGLISVPLGKKANRNTVARCLGTFSKSGIAKVLDNIPSWQLNWTAARMKFNAAIDQVLAIQHAIAQHDLALQTLPGALDTLSAALLSKTEAEEQCQYANERLATIEIKTRENASDLAVSASERRQHSLEWPWWRQLIAHLFRPQSLQLFKAQQQQLSDEYKKIRTSRAALKCHRADALLDVMAASTLLQTRQTVLATSEKKLIELNSLLSDLRERLGVAAFDRSAFHQLSVEEQQKFLPRSNAAYHAARADVFVAGLHLQQAFLKNAGPGFETNFRLALAMLEQQSFLQAHLPEMAPHLWATFFLVVPVVSSTFASIARCFRDLGQNQIGLLLIDEAGQAVPSHALGAIWRSKRAVIVGDPLQVEPVIKMDKKLDQSMRLYHDVPEQHALTIYSAQHLADRGNQFGANVRQYDGSDLWVGSPLRVHRRCVEPMFSLSNEIAYNGKMVFGPSHMDEQSATLERPLLGASCWYDFLSNDFNEHFSPQEGAAAVKIVIEYARQGWIDPKSGLPELFLISPFKSVAQGLTDALDDCVQRWAKDATDEIVKQWLKDHVGTVHTFQGKECESVLFVMGGKTEGARNWAGNRPNIINVAVTRAKRRLYVIGNRKEWAETTFGKRLAEKFIVLDE